MTGEAPSQLEMIELADADRLKCVLKEGLDGVLVKCVHSYPSVKQAALKLTSLRLQIRCLFFSYPETNEVKTLLCSYGHTCERVGSNGHNRVQARNENDCGKQRLSGVPLSQPW